VYQGVLPVTGAGLAFGGVAMSVLNMAWLGVAIAVIGGALITLSKFGPRIAVEPVPVGVRGSRLRVTCNGRPISWRRAKPQHGQR
jgi:hypothetical protein